MIKISAYKAWFLLLSMGCRIFPSSKEIRRLKITCGLFLLSMIASLSSCSHQGTEQYSDKRSLRSLLSFRISKPEPAAPDTSFKAKPVKNKVKKNHPATCYDPVMPLQDSVSPDINIQQPKCYAVPVDPPPPPTCYRKAR